MYSNPRQWKRIRERVLVHQQPIRAVARKEGISRSTLKKMLAHESPPDYRRRNGQSISEKVGAPETSAVPYTETDRQRWMEWLYALEQGRFAGAPLVDRLPGCSKKARQRLLTIIAHQTGFSARSIARHLAVSRNTIHHHLRVFDAQGIDGLLDRKRKARKAESVEFQQTVFALLHEPPSLSGFNRTSWRIADLREVLAKRGFPVCTSVLRETIRKTGFRWRTAKVVLTSTDPDYREKLDKIHGVLSSLGDDERFFSIDEYGPFAIKAKPGRRLASADENPSVPQWQKSKGWLIATAALELSRNQVTHFYSRAKNTDEMIRMVETLLGQYPDTRRLYLSWDAASWHLSKRLNAYVEAHNATTAGGPMIELVPLPASAQFLNVIESVFSGMARAIIHNSDYGSVQEARDAIDRYFAQRNQHFAEHPRRAGRSIWGKERTAPDFNDANNCKDPAYR